MHPDDKFYHYKLFLKKDGPRSPVDNTPHHPLHFTKSRLRLIHRLYAPGVNQVLQ